MEDGVNTGAVAELKRARQVLDAMLDDAPLLKALEAVARHCVERLDAGNKLMFAGNGASAGDAQHLASDLVSRYAFDRPGLAAISLSTDTSVLTAVGNDYGFENAFSRQIEAIGRPGDVFIGISTSGRSPNVLKAFEAARSRGISTVALAGSKGGGLRDRVEHLLLVPSSEAPRVQEAQIMLGHALCGLIERALFSAAS